MFYYVVLNDLNICVETRSSTVSATNPGFIDVTAEIDSGNYELDDLRWRKYENGAWSTEKFEPAPPVPGPDVPGEITSLKSVQADLVFAMVTNNLM